VQNGRDWRRLVRCLVPPEWAEIGRLQEAIAHFYPRSTYAKSLDPSVVERSSSRLFQTPRIGAQVRCPHCGAPHASPVAFDQLLAFTRHHCGAAVEVAPPKVQ
jgi:hypothetical protein